ncbi:hypothetical protein DOY81_004093 [Sarcophaga bullata]|nr:hypothetical protein DOY81_004093 [Sarcophaga bullata]
MHFVVYEKYSHRYSRNRLLLHCQHAPYIHLELQADYHPKCLTDPLYSWEHLFLCVHHYQSNFD